jgi:hypothetical protein
LCILFISHDETQEGQNSEEERMADAVRVKGERRGRKKRFVVV